MRYGAFLFHGLGLVATVFLCTNVFAQPGNTSRLFCHAVGSTVPEPLGDREGHSTTVSEVTCRVEGSMLRGYSINERD